MHPLAALIAILALEALIFGAWIFLLLVLITNGRPYFGKRNNA